MSDPELGEHAELECDLVMKGGITSGVVYPRLVAELSKRYAFRCIGGTSAGAIAAGATAAAQLGVRTRARPDAFQELDRLPALLGAGARGAKGSMLLHLFQPRAPLRAHFALLTSALNAKSKLRMALCLALTAIARFPIGALLCASPGVAVALTSDGVARGIGIVFALLGLVVGAFASALLSFGKRLPAHDFGICNGMPNGATKADALSTWLHEYLNGLAGKPVAEPLTFGELWAGKLRAPGEPAPHDGSAPQQIELSMLTTALNLGRPLRFPFESNDLYFCEQEFEALLPAPVVKWLVSHARASATAKALSKPGRTLHALPLAHDMPVLLGVRMSLSFPLLLCAVPLYSIDRTLAANKQSATEATRVLFSDGGICSNFPVHFFDSSLPSRPTFGVNLRPFHPEHPTSRSWMPAPLKNNTGLKNHIPEISTAPGLGSVFGFLGSILSTMQNWRDEVQTSMPGYRDRIVHVYHAENEGGLNLNMEAKLIETLGDSGVAAAGLLGAAFVPGAAPKLGSWHNHRRIRMRTLLAGIDQQVRGIHVALGQQHAPTWRDVVDDAAADAYPFASAKHRALALEVLQQLADLGKQLESSGIDLADGAPRPEAEWRATPRV